MASNMIVLEGEVRDEFGKGAARRMRVAKQIPATIYAGGADPVFVKLPMKETTLALRHTNALFTIKFGDEQKMAVVKDVQRNPVKRIVEHVDFYEVRAGEKIDVEVPVFVEGEPKGAAVAFVDIQELKVRADVANLPERIVVNVDGMTDGTKVFAKDVVLPEGVELDVEDPEESVVTVEVPEDASAEEAPEAPEAPGVPFILWSPSRIPTSGCERVPIMKPGPQAREHYH